MALGIERGDRVGIWSPNCAEWLITQYAVAKAGGILVNVNPAYRLRELEYALRQSEVSVLIAARRFRNADYVSMLRELKADRLPSLRTLVYLGEGTEPDAGNWHDLCALGDTVDLSRLREREAGLQFDDPATFSTRRAPPARRKEPRSLITTF